MANKTPYKIIAFFMAFLMLFTSTGYSMDLHICQGDVEFISFFGKAKYCHDSKTKAHPKKESCQIKMAEKCHDTSSAEAEDNCCHNETIIVKGDDSSKLTPSITSEISPIFFVAFIAVYLQHFTAPTENLAIASYTPEPPPPLGDIQVLHQSFLL